MSNKHRSKHRRSPGWKAFWAVGGLRLLSALLVFAGWMVCRVSAREALVWGVNGHPFTAYPGVTLKQQIDLVADLGMKIYRVDITALDQVDKLAQLINIAKPRGVAILPVLIPPADLKAQSAEILHATASAFAQVFGRRFKGDIPVWELDNELEGYAIIQPCEMRDDGTKYPCDWGPAGGVGPLEYVGARAAKVVAVLSGLSEGVRAADPTARRALGSAGWGHTGIFDRLHDAGVAWDISVWHEYGGDPEWAFKRLAAFGKPIWITEFNHPLGSSKDGEIGQAEGMRKIMAGFRALAPRYDVEAAFAYELLDETYWASSYEGQVGLMHLDPVPGGGWTLGARKIAYDAVKQTIALDTP